MRPGFNLLLEFGWSTYLDNNGNLRTYDTFISNALDFTLNKTGITAEDFENKDGSRQSNILGLIEKERVDRNGNYEAIFGTITNFNWTFDPGDGSYTCQTQLVGHGNVIESLKVNLNQPTEKDKKTEPAGETEPDPLQANVKNNVFTDYITKIYEDFISAQDTTLTDKNNAALGINDPISFGIQDYKLEGFRSVDSEGAQDLIISGGVVGFTGMQTDSENLNPIQIYVKFSVILAILQKYFLIYDDSDVPYFYFDFNFFDLDNDNNYLVNNPGQFSANPLMCFHPYENHNLKEAGFDIPESTLNKIFTKAAPNFLSDLGHVGKMADIFINIQFLDTVLFGNDLKNAKTGSITLLTFLQAILNGINSSRGGINNFKITTELANNTVLIVDETPPRWKTDNPPTSENTKLCVFNTYGVKNKQEGSIVKNLDIQSQIDQDMMTVIAASTGNRSNGFNANGTGLHKWNQGLVDRIFPNPGDSTDVEDEESEDKLKKLWLDTMNQTGEYNGLFVSIVDGLKWMKTNIDTLISSNQTFQELLIGKMVENNEVNSPYFLPFNFNMDIEGISGIRLYEHFDLDTNILPHTYDSDSLELQIKSCDHTVDANTWTTKTSAIPKPSLPPDAPFTEANALGPDQEPNYAPFDSSAAGGPGGLLPPPPQTPPEDELLRMRITRIMDDGTQTLGMIDVLAEDEQTILFSLASVELPWKDNQNSISCIPADKYRVKSHNSGKHGNCFWLIGNEAGGYAFNKLFGNGYIRSAVLIHRAPQAPNWLQGCIGPGNKFNTKTNQTGRQKGTGTNYLDPAKSESIQATNKILNELFSVGSFRMEIVNEGGVASGSLPKTFNSSVQALAQSKNLL